MKELWKDGKLSIGYLDDDNFYVGEWKTRKTGKKKGEKHLVDMTYHRKLKDAITAALMLNIGRKAETLEEYAKLLSHATERLETVLKPLEAI